MKKTAFARILTIMVALVLTFAAWMPTLAAENTLPVFMAGFVKDDQAFGCGMFYMQDEYGKAYLVTSSVTDAFLEEGYAPVLMGVGVTKNLEYLGTQDYLSYYKAEGMDRFEPIPVASYIADGGTIYSVIIDDDAISEVDSVDGFTMGDEGDWKQISGGLYYAPDSEMNSMLIGTPVLNDNGEVMAIMTTTTDLEYAYVELTDMVFPNGYSLLEISAPQDPAQQESAQNDPTQQPAPQEPVSEAPATRGESVQQPKKNVPWGLILIVAGVVAVGFVAAKSAKQKSERTKAKSSVQEGTIALDVMKESPVKENKPAMDSITVENIVVNEPMAESVPVQRYAAAQPQWQVRGIGGELNGFVYLLRDRLSFGRDPQCEVAFKTDARGISGMHCELVLENGRVQLSDLQSAYGTFLAGGVRLEPRVRYDLNSGDEFTLANGGQTFRLEPVGTMEHEQPLAVRSVPGGEVTHADVNGEILFGRDMRCRIKFEESESAVSGMHCKLYYGSDGKLYQMDLDSTNGTFLSERERLRPNVPYRVRKGQAFYLAAPRYTYVVIEE